MMTKVENQFVYAGSQSEQTYVRTVLYPACKQHVSIGDCRPSTTTEVFVFITVGVALVYFLITYVLLVWKMQKHKAVSYHIVQMGSLFYRLQVTLLCTQFEVAMLLFVRKQTSRSPNDPTKTRSAHQARLRATLVLSSHTGQL